MSRAWSPVCFDLRGRPRQRLKSAETKASRLTLRVRAPDTFEPSLAGGFSGLVANWRPSGSLKRRCKPQEHPRSGRRLDARDVSGLEPFGSLGHIELDGLTFIQTPVTRFLDRREVDKYVLAC